MIHTLPPTARNRTAKLDRLHSFEHVKSGASAPLPAGRRARPSSPASTGVGGPRDPEHYILAFKCAVMS
jgi:hypothetical protein